jgi:hypothetical protein
VSSKFQIIKVNIPATANPEVSINSEVDRLFSKIKRIAFYTDADRDANKNLTMVNGLKIGGKEIYPDNFDTGLLFPRNDNSIFTEQVINDCAGETVETKLKYTGTPSAALTGKLILFLEK